MTGLTISQIWFLVLSLFMAAVPVLLRLFHRETSVRHEQARWVLVCANLLYAVVLLVSSLFFPEGQFAWQFSCLVLLVLLETYFLVKRISFRPTADIVSEAVAEMQSRPEHCEDFSLIHANIQQWVALRTYLNATMTIKQALNEIGTDADTLNRYLNDYLHLSGYRQWISYLRIEEAKKLLKDYPAYSLNAVGNMCGFVEGSNFARAFRMQTGLTPSEWKKKYCNTQQN